MTPQEFRLKDELLACPSCSSGRIRQLDFVRSQRRKGNYIIFVSGCDDCGSIFVNPPPNASQIEAYYSEDGDWKKKKGYEELESKSGPSAENITDENIGKSSVHTIVAHARKIFGPTLDGLEVLDFGCGRGQLLDRLRPYGFETFGLDPAMTNLVTRHRMLTELPTDRVFAVISAIHVLEHVPNVLETLTQLRRALRPGGLFVCGMPALDDLEIHREKRYVANKEQHISAFTRRSLSALLARAGFQAVAFYPGAKAHRFRCAAVWSDNPERVESPLQDAERAFRLYRETEPDWRPEFGSLSVRQLAYLANASRHEELLKLKAQRHRPASLQRAG